MTAAPGGAVPDDSAERLCWAAGERVVVGVDEVGRGAWAGPMTVGAVVMPAPPDGTLDGALAGAHTGTPAGIRDSKLLTPAARERLHGDVDDWCAGWAVGHATSSECDALGMSAALRLATRRALAELPVTPDRVLVDGRWNFVDWLPSRAIVKGDRRCVSIAAASIMAKVTRDRLMAEVAPHFPPYGFERNKGYPAPVHLAALAEYGPCSLHRTSWAFMDRVPDAVPVPVASPADALVAS